MNLSIVIICKNEAAVIAATIEAATELGGEIIIVDTGSTDGTLDILRNLPVTIISTEWLGFGPTKNLGIAHAAADWILSIDADEVIDHQLVQSIQNIDFSAEENIYAIQFLNYLGTVPLKHGEWGNDKHLRLFHKKRVCWNDATVHEQLIFKAPVKVKKLEGFIHHKTSPNKQALQVKMEAYAKWSAEHHFSKGKKYALLKAVVSPPFNFIRNYIFRLGFLDGTAGLQVAIENARYTYKKYLYLHQLNQQQ